MSGTALSITMTNILYIATGIVSIGSIFIASRLNESKKHTRKIEIALYCLSFLTLVIVLGYRGNSPDYENYIKRYFLLQDRSLLSQIGYMEPLYALLTYASGLLFGDYYQPMFVIFAFISIAFVYLELYRVRKRINPTIWIFGFVTLIYPFYFAIVRQALAMGIVLFANRYFNREDKWKYIALTVIATMFHYSAIIMIPILVLYLLQNQTSIRKHAKLMFPLLIGLFLVSLLVVNLLIGVYPWINRYLYYFKVGKIYFSSVLNLLNFALLIPVILIFKKKHSESLQPVRMYIYQYQSLVMMVLLTLLLPVGRITYYLFFPGIYLNAYFYNELEHLKFSSISTRSLRIIYIVVLVVISCLWLYLKFIASDSFGSTLFPYYFNMF
ncbi:EpsG family protein [Erysipelothrix sp. HDW6C]|uniref:EpsG family protein n=1 Tax=Erysipelothrix sp. HDW6C TaxID=2714930 RepID=UPI001409096D|nr:EpsG family protein [Erysipelothrix sp. HDW6C]QIK70031.1 EpsG family protein [Erysipelothrix sp. HDW6C]